MALPDPTYPYPSSSRSNRSSVVDRTPQRLRPARGPAVLASVPSSVPRLTSSSSAENGDQIVSQELSTSEIRKLYKQQEKLQASTTRIELLLKEMQDSCGTSDLKKNIKVPRELSAIVRDVYSSLIDEDDDGRTLQWNLSVSFDDESNRHINAEVIKNVQGVVDRCSKNECTPTLIKRALRTYFKSQKSRHSRKLLGKEPSDSAAARKRQRRHNKAHARMKVLNNSTTIDEDTKAKVKPLLKGEYMSSEESANEVVGDSDHISSSCSSSDNDEEDRRQGKRAPKRKSKKLIKHPLMYRSRELQSLIESLDRKLERRRTSRSKAMCLPVEIGMPSQRKHPADLPDWACDLFA